MSDAEDAGAATAVGREIWIEKYRPQTLDDIHGQEEIVERLSSYIEQDDVPHLLFGGPAGVGKCVTGETPVVTNDGIKPIADVVGRDVEGFAEPDDGLRIATMTDRNEFEYVRPSHVFGKTGEELVEIRTRDGAELRVTPEHRLRVLTHDGFDWVRAAEISDGDRIARPTDLPTPDGDVELRWTDEMDPERTEVTLDTERAEALGVDRTTTLGELREAADDERWIDAVETIAYVTPQNARSRRITPPSTVTPLLARFIGLAISEARIDGGRIKFYNTDETLLDAFETAAHELFNVETTSGTQHDVPFVRIGSRTLTHYLESVFDVFASATGETRIGSAMIEADDDSRAAFLRAMFDAEAHVGSSGTIELTQRNERHITLLSYLLSTFGIQSRRTTERKAATNGTGTERTYHTLSISGAESLRSFRDAVGFSVPHKADRLATHAEKDHNPNDDTIPAQTVLRDLCERLDIPATEHLPKSMDPDTPSRERYCTALDGVVDAATKRLDEIQRAIVRLDRLEPDIGGVSSVPAAWVGERHRLAPVGTRKAVSETVDARTDRLLEYSDGRRTPRSDRLLRILETIDEPIENARIDRVQRELDECVELIGTSYSAIGAELSMHSSEISNLLKAEEPSIASLTRFSSVHDLLRELATERLALETIDRIDEADRIANADLHYDRVDDVERVGTDERVYDLTVPGSRNYVAGSVPTVMHNTTAATAIAREIYGDDWRGNFLELNASDQRGIDVVRDRIKGFARSSFGGDFRIVFLDEADSLTDDAQAALRRTMEQFSDNTRFILSCNYSSKIIDPIQSRCAVFRFSPLSDEAVAAQVREIAVAEGIEVTDDGVDALVYAAAGDMRRAINSLQAAATTGEVVDEAAVYAITATARPEEIESMVTDAIEGDFTKARATLDTLLTETGMAGGDVIDQLHRSVWGFDLPERETVRLMERIGEIDYRIADGANERVQLEALLASLALRDD